MTKNGRTSPGIEVHSNPAQSKARLRSSGPVGARASAALVAGIDGAGESAVLRTRGHAAWVRLVCAASGGAARPHARDAALRGARRRLVAVPLALAADGLDLPLVVALPAPEDPEAAPPAAWTALDCAVAS